MTQSFFFLGYYDRPLKEVCNDTDHIIQSELECKTAIKELGYQPLQDFYTGTADDVPYGCSVRIILSQSPPFKPHLIELSGKGKGHPNFSPICKGPENAGDIQFISEFF